MADNDKAVVPATATSYPPNQQIMYFLYDVWLNGGTNTPHGDSALYILGYLLDVVQNGGTGTPGQLPLVAADGTPSVLGNVLAKLDKIDTDVNAKATPTVTLTDAQVSQLATQIAAKLPTPPSLTDIKGAIHDVIKGQWDK